jgi:hypothetical protein
MCDIKNRFFYALAKNCLSKKIIKVQLAFPDLVNDDVRSTLFFSDLTQVDIMLGFNSQEGLMVTSLFKGRMSIPLKIRISTFFTLTFDFHHYRRQC